MAQSFDTTRIFSVDEAGFEALALDVFRYQYAHVPIYKAYVDAIKKDVSSVQSLRDIPFLPIRFFKSHDVIADGMQAELLFESSGTTGMEVSRHKVASAAVYDESFRKGFELFYGHPDEFCIMGLLPNYLERQHSSLVHMVNELMKLSGRPDNDYYLYDHERLARTLERLDEVGPPVMLFGVTFALLDFADVYNLKLRNVIVMETGGMKGRKKEMTRTEVHSWLRERLGLDQIHSEYGMTELLSQAYAKADGIFETPPWMKAMVSEYNDPLSNDYTGKGTLNIIDLANIYSCSFIATEDVGVVEADGRFTVQGRIDHSALRGCNFLLA